MFHLPSYNNETLRILHTTISAKWCRFPAWGAAWWSEMYHHLLAQPSFLVISFPLPVSFAILCRIVPDLNLILLYRTNCRSDIKCDRFRARSIWPGILWSVPPGHSNNTARTWWNEFTATSAARRRKMEAIVVTWHVSIYPWTGLAQLSIRLEVRLFSERIPSNQSTFERTILISATLLSSTS